MAILDNLTQARAQRAIRRICIASQLFQPRSGVRAQPIAQAMGKSRETEEPQRGERLCDRKGVRRPTSFTRQFQNGTALQ